MFLKEFITEFIAKYTKIAVFDEKTNQEYFESKAFDLLKSDDKVLSKTVTAVEPDYNYAGWLIIVVRFE